MTDHKKRFLKLLRRAFNKIMINKIAEFFIDGQPLSKEIFDKFVLDTHAEALGEVLDTIIVLEMEEY